MHIKLSVTLLFFAAHIAASDYSWYEQPYRGVPSGYRKTLIGADEPMIAVFEAHRREEQAFAKRLRTMIRPELQKERKRIQKELQPLRKELLSETKWPDYLLYSVGLKTEVGKKIDATLEKRRNKLLQQAESQLLQKAESKIAEEAAAVARAKTANREQLGKSVYYLTPFARSKRLRVWEKDVQKTADALYNQKAGWGWGLSQADEKRLKDEALKEARNIIKKPPFFYPGEPEGAIKESQESFRYKIGKGLARIGREAVQQTQEPANLPPSEILYFGE